MVSAQHDFDTIAWVPGADPEIDYTALCLVATGSRLIFLNIGRSSSVIAGSTRTYSISTRMLDSETDERVVPSAWYPIC
jgi:hypothetical protein